MLFIYLKGVYQSPSTRTIVGGLIRSTKLSNQVGVSSTNVVKCRTKRGTSPHVHSRTTHEKCGLSSISHPMYARSFFSFSLVVKVSGHGVSSLGQGTPSLRSIRGVRRVARCSRGGLCSRIPSPCCDKTRNFRLILSLLRSTYTKLLSRLMRFVSSGPSG